MKVVLGLAGKAVRLPLRLVPKGMVVPVLSGQLRGARWVVGSATHGCWIGSYERLTREWMCRLLGPGQVAYDIGANAGFFTLLAARRVGETGTVVAFEPLPENLRVLRRHVSLNGARNVTVIDAAVAGGFGTATFKVAENPAMGGLSQSGTLAVRTVALDGLVEENAIPSPDFLKIDVEGGELQVLEGARSILTKRAPQIILSAHGTGLFETCRSFLLDLDYRLEVARNGAADGDYLLIGLKSRGRA